MRRNKWRFTGSLGGFFVAMLVFAPGQTWPEAPPTTPWDSGNLAARILAPTVDQGLAGDGQVAGIKRLVHQRDKGSKGRDWPVAFAVGVALLAPVLVPVAVAGPRKPRSRLAAPTSNRDRAPPLLQPA